MFLHKHCSSVPEKGRLDICMSSTDYKAGRELELLDSFIDDHVASPHGEAPIPEDRISTSVLKVRSLRARTS